MENILKDINAVVGVTGSFICDGDGQMIARALPSVFDETMLLPVGRTMSQTIAGLKTARRRKASELDLVYRDGRLVVKNLRGGCLCILCTPTINIPLLNLTANVAARKLAERLKALEKEQADEPEAKAPPEPILDAEFLDKLKQELTREIGPIAALILDEKVADLGDAGASNPRERMSKLIEKVGAEIGDEASRLRFQRTMEEAIEES